MLILVEVLSKPLKKFLEGFTKLSILVALAMWNSFSFQKDELKKILNTKEKQQEESLRTIEALKAKLKYYEVRRVI